METPPTGFAVRMRHVLKGATLNLLGRCIRQRTPIAGVGLKSRDTPNGRVLYVADPAKTAIVPVGDDWVAWFCVESDRPFFRIIRDVPLDGVHSAGVRSGEVVIEAEMIESCDAGSLEVVSTMPVGGLAFTGATISAATLSATAVLLPGSGQPDAVRVVMQGVRKGCDAQWPRFSEDEARANNAFWASAHDTRIWPAIGEVVRRIWRRIQP